MGFQRALPSYLRGGPPTDESLLDLHNGLGALAGTESTAQTPTPPELTSLAEANDVLKRFYRKTP
jgi:hypothetical protein